MTKSGATVSFSTNEAGTTILDYGLTTDYGTNKTDATFVSDHSSILSGLQSGKTYHVRIKSQDSSGNLVTSSDQTFSTFVDLPPSNVSSLSVVASDKTLVLSWTNPTDDDFAGVRILRCLSLYPSGPTDATCSVVLDNSSAQTLTQTGLTNSTTYYYGVFCKRYSFAVRFWCSCFG